MEDRVQQLEAEIGQTEDAIARLEAALQSFISAGDTQRQSHELEQQKASHAALIEEWEEMSEALQTAE